MNTANTPNPDKLTATDRHAKARDAFCAQFDALTRADKQFLADKPSDAVTQIRVLLEATRELEKSRARLAKSLKAKRDRLARQAQETNDALVKVEPISP